MRYQETIQTSLEANMSDEDLFYKDVEGRMESWNKTYQKEKKNWGKRLMPLLLSLMIHDSFIFTLLNFEVGLWLTYWLFRYCPYLSLVYCLPLYIKSNYFNRFD